MDDSRYVRKAAKFIAELEGIQEPDFDEMLDRASLGSPVAKYIQEQGEEIVQRMNKKSEESE